jgi:hypothetical protein
MDDFKDRRKSRERDLLGHDDNSQALALIGKDYWCRMEKLGEAINDLVGEESYSCPKAAGAFRVLLYQAC